mmetsp:Transcript_24672/g.54097  ORF Transcript_24672/g.54097 Transcript_24672/m.54097 type:complete len:256 (-) Transcript_24672:1890-2657(-)
MPRGAFGWLRGWKTTRGTRISRRIVVVEGRNNPTPVGRRNRHWIAVLCLWGQAISQIWGGVPQAGGISPCQSLRQIQQGLAILVDVSHRGLGGRNDIFVTDPCRCCGGNHSNGGKRFGDQGYCQRWTTKEARFFQHFWIAGRVRRYSFRGRYSRDRKDVRWWCSSTAVSTAIPTVLVSIVQTGNPTETSAIIAVVVTALVGRCIDRKTTLSIPVSRRFILCDFLLGGCNGTVRENADIKDFTAKVPLTENFAREG